MKNFFLKIVSVVVGLFGGGKSTKTEVTNNNTKIVEKEVKIVEKVNETKGKLSVEQIVDALDKVHSSNDDLYTSIGLLVAELHDVYTADSKEIREEQKQECYNTVQYIMQQLIDL